ncbi:CAAX geranylgeranyltransferase alpha subunit [Agyrium rufum]|nr:CAAX geranylgeranyltransferase alpha subunit [Agyrium rufum]
MGIYEDSTKWADIVPIPQDEGGPNPLAAIAYTDEYSEAMSYLRALMAKDECSERAIDLTEHIISMNPSHYTVWLYRAKVIRVLGSDLQEELNWLNVISLKHLKNYQIWHHRQVIMSQVPHLPSNEIPFLARMLSKEVKNYHVWSYRQWLVRHFSLWDAELPFVEALLRSDIRNNSAWNHRWYVTFGRADFAAKEQEYEHEQEQDLPSQSDTSSEKKEKEEKEIPPPSIYEREIDFAQQAIEKAPQNQSPWNYLRGVLKKQGQGLGKCKVFAEKFANVEEEEGRNGVTSSHALEFLADVWAEEKEKERAEKALDLLAQKYDPIRKNYWRFKKGLLEQAIAAA